MSAILFSADLMTSSRVGAAATQAGCKLICSANQQTLPSQAEEHHAQLVVLDLTMPGLDLAALVPRLRELSAPPRLLAFGPHVHEAVLQRALETGCDVVMARGQFFAQLDNILAPFGSGDR